MYFGDNQKAHSQYLGWISWQDMIYDLLFESTSKNMIDNIPSADAYLGFLYIFELSTLISSWVVNHVSVLSVIASLMCMECLEKKIVGAGAWIANILRNEHHFCLTFPRLFVLPLVSITKSVCSIVCVNYGTSVMSIITKFMMRWTI